MKKICFALFKANTPLPPKKLGVGALGQWKQFADAGWPRKCAIWCRIKHHGWRGLTAKGAVIARVGPEPSGFSPASA